MTQSYREMSSKHRSVHQSPHNERHVLVSHTLPSSEDLELPLCLEKGVSRLMAMSALQGPAAIIVWEHFSLQTIFPRDLCNYTTKKNRIEYCHTCCFAAWAVNPLRQWHSNDHNQLLSPAALFSVARSFIHLSDFLEAFE